VLNQTSCHKVGNRSIAPCVLNFGSKGRWHPNTK